MTREPEPFKEYKITSPRFLHQVGEPGPRLVEASPDRPAIVRLPHQPKAESQPVLDDDGKPVLGKDGKPLMSAPRDPGLRPVGEQVAPLQPANLRTKSDPVKRAADVGKKEGRATDA